MRAVIQRVMQAEVSIDAEVCARIKQGILVLVGIEDADGEADIEWLCNKICGLRIFNDTDGIPNLSVRDVGADLLIVSQFTLQASVKKGNRPGYSKASKPGLAKPVYEACLQSFSALLGRPVQSGIFGADMQVSLVNDGPMTFIFDTKLKDHF